MGWLVSIFVITGPIIKLASPGSVAALSASVAVADSLDMVSCWELLDSNVDSNLDSSIVPDVEVSLKIVGCSVLELDSGIEGLPSGVGSLVSSTASGMTAVIGSLALLTFVSCAVFVVVFSFLDIAVVDVV